MSKSAKTMNTQIITGVTHVMMVAKIVRVI
jgi:hypothetical protein